MKMRASVGIISRLHIGESSIPATTTVASGCCTCVPMPLDIAAGTRPRHADSAVMNTWRMRVLPADSAASSTLSPSWRFRRTLDTSRMPSMVETPNNEMNPMAAETLRLRPDTQSPRMPPATANGMPASASRLSRMELKSA